MELGEWKEKSSQAWTDFCDQVEVKGGPIGELVSRNILNRIVVNAPVLLSFVLICTLLHICSVVVPGIRPILAVDDRFTESWNPFSYLSLFTNVQAHENWAHLQGNMVHLLLVGPSVEHAFGSKNLLIIIVLVAFTSALVHLAIGKQYTYQLGASGVVFACIMLSSLVTASTGTLPLSFLIVATWWLGDEVWKFFFSGDAVSHHAHLSGGIVGTVAGYYIHQKRAKQNAQGMAKKWLSGIRAVKKKR